ncbi:hypothetical protein ACHAPT_004791 [Fusarium lateritium]
MHVLHGFGQRRKSSRRPRDLHIRKVSFSGSSLSSGCSLSSSSSTISDSSTPTQTPIATTRPEIDPLASHPAFHAPPRLYERPFIRMDETEPVFYGGNDDEQYAQHEAVQQPIEMALPPHVSPMDVADEQCKESQDYFFTTTLSKRPPMPGSRWSESTIQTLDQFDNSDSEDSDEITQSEESEDEDDDNASVLEMRRLTRRASALKTISLSTTYAAPARPGLAPKRPPMRSLDSVDNFIRRGGWKRRGIVFRQEDMENQRCEADRASY